MAQQSLKQALHLARAGKSKDLAYAVTALDGCPVGGWGETAQAWRRLRECLPHRELRTYTVEEFVEEAYTVDHADRYRTREVS